MRLLSPIAWAVKSLSEFLFLKPMATAFREEELRCYCIPTGLVHPLSVTVFRLLGLFGAFRWKEDKAGIPKDCQ